MNELLAYFIDKLKAKDPKTFLIIGVVLLVANYAFDNAVQFGILTSTPQIAKVFEVISTIALLLVGSRTTRFLVKPEENKQ